MNTEKYQIFVSSTYEDLRKERDMALDKILKLHQIFWHDINDLESKLGDSLANVMREFPAATRWKKVG